MANLTVVLRCETYFWVAELTIKMDWLEQTLGIIEYAYSYYLHVL